MFDASCALFVDCDRPLDELISDVAKCVRGQRDMWTIDCSWASLHVGHNSDFDPLAATCKMNDVANFLSGDYGSYFVPMRYSAVSLRKSSDVPSTAYDA